MPDRPMYECTTCTSSYVTPLAADLCCADEYDRASFARSYD